MTTNLASPKPLKIPLSKIGASCSPGKEPILAPGVRGFAILGEDGSLYIPLIRAEREGNGDVGRFLDSLPTDRNVKIPSVVSERLEDMLHRRGFVLSHEFDDGEMCEIWLRPARSP